MIDSIPQPDAFKQLASSKISPSVRVELLNDLAEHYLPPSSALRGRIQRLKLFNSINEPDQVALDDLIEAAALWIQIVGPYVPPTESPLGGSKDIETEVRLYVNEKFTKSPYFIAVSGLLAICLTLFSVGLMNLNKDVRSADETVAKMQQEIGTEKAAMSAAQDKQLTELMQRGREFYDRMDASESRIKDSEKNVALTIDTRFKQELDEVRTTKSDTMKAITNQGNDAANKINTTLAGVQTENIQKINDRGRELYYQLEKPTWRQMAIVGFKTNWPIWAISLIAIILSLVAIIRS